MTHDSTAEVAALAEALAARPAYRSRWSLEGRIQAGVCVPLHFGSRGLEIWAIKRTDGMRNHAREIAFPGGKQDDGDRDLADTALREMEEELGIPRAQLRLLGGLGAFPTATSRFTLNAFVALVADGAVAEPQAGEVAVLIRMVVGDFFGGRIPFRAVDLGPGRRSPIFDFDVGSMYGASAHVLEEMLLTYAGVHGLDMPEPALTDEIPWL